MFSLYAPTLCLVAAFGSSLVRCLLLLHLFAGDEPSRVVLAAAPESRLDWFQNPTVNKGLGAGLATIALAGDVPALAMHLLGVVSARMCGLNHQSLDR